MKEAIRLGKQIRTLMDNSPRCITMEIILLNTKMTIKTLKGITLTTLMVIQLSLNKTMIGVKIQELAIIHMVKMILIDITID